MIFACGVEAGAGFGREVAVTEDACVGIFFEQGGKECEERLLLSVGAGIGAFAQAVEAAHIGDAYGAGVLSTAMRADLLDRSARLDCSVETDQEMVTYGAPALRAVPAVNLGSGDVATKRGCGAVDDDFVDFTHN